MRAAIQERRRHARRAVPSRTTIDVVSPGPSVLISRLNCSEGGLCVRLEQAPEVRSLVRLRWTPAGRGSGIGQDKAGIPVEFSGRVAWVMQRLDLRTAPPFLYDVGIEFVDPPPLLRQLIARGASGEVTSQRPAVPQKTLPPAVIRGREFVPQLGREPGPPTRWHLVVAVDGVPCFSGRYPSERAARLAWNGFKQQQGKREARAG